MIYLVGGAPHCGKSTVAKKTAHRLRVSCIATDTIESVVLRLYTTPQEMRELFPKTWIRKQAKASTSNDLLFGQTPPDMVAKALIQQSRAIWDAIEVIVGCEVSAGRSIIIEGYHIHPKLANSLRIKYGRRSVRAVFLTRYDREKIIRSCSRHPAAGGNNWFIQKTGIGTKLENIGHMITLFSSFLAKESRKYNCKIICTDFGYRKRIRDAIAVLAE